jgi:DNA-binding response OmpR family regulator
MDRFAIVACSTKNKQLFFKVIYFGITIAYVAAATLHREPDLMSTTISILLVEDDSVLCRSLTDYLGAIGHTVTAVSDSLSYYRALSERTFDVVVIDLGLPDQDGAILIQYTRQNTPSAIIVITARDTLDTRVTCYETGADLFLGKPVKGRELAAAISSLARRRQAMTDQATDPNATANADAPGVWCLIASQRALRLPTGELITLTPREYRLLYLLANGNGEPVPRAVLLDALYARQDESAQRALETLIRRTRKKIAERYSGPSPILTQHGFGYVLTAPFRRG